MARLIRVHRADSNPPFRGRKQSEFVDKLVMSNHSGLVRFGLFAALVTMCLVGSGATSAHATRAVAKVRTPTSGAYLGIFSDLPGLTSSQSIAKREAQIGRPFAIDAHYYNWTDPFPTAAEVSDKALGRIPMITWWGTDYASINSGSQDSLIRSDAARVRDFGAPVLLRWGAEMNGNWYAWSGPSNGNNPGGFVQAWRRIHDIFATVGATNVSWVWAPNADSHPGGTDVTSWNSWRAYYPGDTYVDWVGIDGYNWGTLPNEQWQTFGQIFAGVYSDYSARKPIMIAETGSTSSGGSKSSWITGAGAWLKTHRDVRAVVWFDTNESSSGIDWRLDSTSDSLAAFKTLALDPYFSPTG